MDWNENEHFVLVFMKMSVLKPKTGSINSGTGTIQALPSPKLHTFLFKVFFMFLIDFVGKKLIYLFCNLY